MKMIGTKEAGWVKPVLMVVAMACAFAVYVVPFPDLAHEAHVALALLAFVIVLWVFEALPLGVSALLFAALCIVLLGGADTPITPAIVFSGFGNSNFWLMLGAFLVGNAILKTDLAKRIVLIGMAHAGNSYRRMVLMIWGSSLVIGLLIPSGTARAAVFVPIMAGVIAVYQPPTASRLHANLLMHVFLSGACASLLWYTGTPMNAIAMQGLDAATGYHVTFLSWFVWMIVPAAFFFLGNFLIIERLCPPEKEVVGKQAIEGFLEAQLKELGSLGPAEKRIAALFVLMVVLWMTEDMHGIGAAWIAMMAAAVLFLPKIGVLRKEDLGGLPWDVLLLLGVALGLDGILSSVGLTDWIISSLVEPILGPAVAHGPVLMVLGIVVVVGIVHFFLTGGIAETTAMTPIIVSFVVGTGGNGVLAAIAVARTAQDCVIFPFQSLPANVLYGTGYIGMRRFVLLSGACSAFNCFVWNVAMVPYWDWITRLVA